MERSPVHELKGEGRLCKLSPELLSLITGFCEPMELCALARTCRLLYSHAMPVLCHSVVVRQEQTARLLGFLALLKPHLIQQVRSASVFAEWGPEGERIRLIDSMTKLRNLSIEYSVWAEIDRIFDHIPILPVLATTLRTCSFEVLFLSDIVD